MKKTTNIISKLFSLGNKEEPTVPRQPSAEPKRKPTPHPFWSLESVDHTLIRTINLDSFSVEGNHLEELSKAILNGKSVVKLDNCLIITSQILYARLVKLHKRNYEDVNLESNK